jgi:RNA polymerase sigma factor (sigma-70 family)
VAADFEEGLMYTKGYSVHLDAALLVARARSGDEAAWSALVDRYGPLVHRVARSFRLNAADAADVSQTVWLRLIESVGRLHEPQHIAAWLATTTRRECLNLLRRSRRQLPFGDEAVFDGDAGAEPLDAGVLRSVRNEEVRRAYATLPTRCRQVLRVVHAEPAPAYADIAGATGMSVGSVGPTRARCLESLRRSLEAHDV